MGIMDKIKQFGAFQPKSTSDIGDPITGGNNYTLRHELKARIDNLTNWFKQSHSRRNSDEFVYDEYFLMLFQKNYFVNLFDIETDDVEFKKCWNLFVELCFWFGDAAIINNGIKDLPDTTTLIPVYIKDKKYTPLGDIDKDFNYIAGGYIIPLIGENKGDVSKLKLDYIKNVSDDFVYAKWNTQGYGAWVWLYKFIKFQKDLMKLTHNTAYLQREILFLNANNVDSIETDADQIYNPDTNVIVQLGVDWENDGKMNNRWMVDTPSNDKNMTINDVYDWHINTYYDLFGRRRNVDFKKERNVVSEVDASQEQFDILTNETFKYFEIALKECKDKFGKQGDFKFYGRDKENDNGDMFRDKENNNSILKENKESNKG